MLIYRTTGTSPRRRRNEKETQALDDGLLRMGSPFPLYESPFMFLNYLKWSCEDNSSSIFSACLPLNKI
jgi:hypothetical protein